ncbi:MAG: hypothetical protein ACKVUT_13555 [Gaiella sp.]
MRRIAVIGCTGSGKTTLARILGVRLGIDVVHGDFLGRTGGTRAQGEEWARLHAELIGRPVWILDAMRISTLERRLEVADTVVFLDLPRRACLAGLLRRRLRHRRTINGVTGVAAMLTWDIVSYVWRFGVTERPRITELLARSRPGLQIVVLRSRREVRHFAATVSRNDALLA